MSKQRTFTAKSQAGDIPAGHTFTEDDFKRLHPLPDNPERHRINPDTYHAGLLGRLLSLGVIEPAAETAEPSAIPDGAVAIQQEQERLQKESAAPAAPPVPTKK